MKLGRHKFAGRFELDAPTIQDREQVRRVPGRAARALPTVIERDTDTDAVMHALAPPVD